MDAIGAKRIMGNNSAAETGFVNKVCDTSDESKDAKSSEVNVDGELQDAGDAVSVNVTEMPKKDVGTRLDTCLYFSLELVDFPRRGQ